MTNQDTNPYANLSLRNQIYRESRAMAEYALSKGKAIPASAIQNIEAMEVYTVDESGEKTQLQMRRDIDIKDLIRTHDMLVRIVAPATPQTILLLDIEQEKTALFKFLGSVSLVRQLMIATLISLFFFISLMATSYINSATLTDDVLSAEGFNQLAVLIFYISAAGLGASFAALYKANIYISKGIFDSGHQSSYWIRFSLGIIAGILLSLLISEKSLQVEGLLSQGTVRPLLAILGGFSADLLYTFLNRMIETLKSLFEGNLQNILDIKAQEAKSKLINLEVEQRMKLSQSLMKMQIGADGNAEEMKQQINELLEDLLDPK